MKGFGARDRLERFDQMSNEADEALCVSDGWVALRERGGMLSSRELGGAVSLRELGGTVSSRELGEARCLRATWQYCRYCLAVLPPARALTPRLRQALAGITTAVVCDDSCRGWRAPYLCRPRSIGEHSG
jgi:hypothetical protein